MVWGQYWSSFACTFGNITFHVHKMHSGKGQAMVSKNIGNIKDDKSRKIYSIKGESHYRVIYIDLVTMNFPQK